MESEINKKIREILEMFGINDDKVIGKWSLVGHLKNLVNDEVIKENNEIIDKARIIVSQEMSNLCGDVNEKRDKIIGLLKSI